MLTELSMLLDLLPAAAGGSFVGSRVPAATSGLTSAPATVPAPDPTLGGILPGGGR